MVGDDSEIFLQYGYRARRVHSDEVSLPVSIFPASKIGIVVCVVHINLVDSLRHLTLGMYTHGVGRYPFGYIEPAVVVHHIQPAFNGRWTAHADYVSNR